MQKPFGISRKDYHAMKAIVRQFLNDPSAPVDFLLLDPENPEKSPSSAVGYQSLVHDEGYSATGIEVFLDQPGTYSVSVDTNGRDCDGRTSHHSEYTVIKGGKRKRFYMSRNWETNRPNGKFSVKSPFKIIGKGRSSQRDYTAEAAGY